MLVTSSEWRLDGQRYLQLDLLERILANISDQDHHRVHGVHDGGDTVKSCSNVCPRRNSISKDSNYTTSPLKPIIVLKGLYG